MLAVGLAVGFVLGIVTSGFFFAIALDRIDRHLAKNDSDALL